MEPIPQPDVHSPAVNIHKHPKTEPLRNEPREPSQEEVAAMIADTLGETEEGARKSILHIVRAAGRTHARELLNMTLQAEAHGGVMVPDGSRRRTPGGVFFSLAYSIGKAKNGRPIQRPWNGAKKPRQEQAPVQAEAQAPVKQPKPTPQPVPVFVWNDRLAAMKEAMQEKGSATTVKMTLIGRPGYVLDKQQFVVVTMEHAKTPALPKGLPTPPSTPTQYGVYIAAKQWSKVKEALADPEDALIVEGVPKIDMELGAIAVFTTNVTTKKLQMAKKQPQQAAQ